MYRYQMACAEEFNTVTLAAGLRLYAMRDEEGARQADCRVNGDDWEKGAQALRDYVKTWPAAAFELRKQYVVLHSVTSGSSPPDPT